MRRIVKVLVAVLGLAAAAAFLFLLTALRTKSPWMLRAVRRMNKRGWNRATMRVAGSPGSPAAVVHHVGRVSGRTYATPVVALAVEDGFVIALPYGRTADWLQNVLAAGGAVIQHEGVEHAVTEPRVLPVADYWSAFPTSDQWQFRVFNVTDCLHVRHLASLPGA